MTWFALLMLLIRVVGVFAVTLVTVLLTIWAERKIVARMQTRIGPNRVGPAGLLQSFADGVKLFFKEDVRPSNADRLIFGLAPIIMVVPAFLSLTVLQWGDGFGGQPARVTDINVGLLFILAMGSLQVYGIVLAGWASGSNYPLLGGIRSSAQMVSYEIAQGLSLVGVFMYAGSLSAAAIVASQRGNPYFGFLPHWYVLPQLPLFVVFCLAGLAETNRAPFDLPEAETELVGGYHTEYSGIKFALFFLAEYINMVTISAVATTAFLGGPDGPVFPFMHHFLPWLWPILWFIGKIWVFLFCFIWVRATLPRVRFDRLMTFGWKVLIPVALVWLGVTGVVLVVHVNRRYVLYAIGIVLVLLIASLVVGGRGERGEPEPPDQPPEEDAAAPPPTVGAAP